MFQKKSKYLIQSQKKSPQKPEKQSDFFFYQSIFFSKNLFDQ